VLKDTTSHGLSLLWGRLARRLALEGASPRIKRICADAHIRIYAHTYHHVCVRACVRVCARIYSELAFQVDTNASMPCIPTPSAPPTPPPE